MICRARYFIVFFLIFDYAYGQSFKKVKKEFTVLNIVQDTICIKPIKKPVIILLASENTCSMCYDKLEELFLANSSFDSMTFMVVFRLPNNIAIRREYTKRYKVFRYADSFYYDLTSSNGMFLNDKYEDGLWGKLKIQRTPAILLLYENRYSFYNYEAIFDDLDISIKFKRDWLKFTSNR